MLIGVGLPFLYVQALIRLTRLGGRELSLSYQDFRIPHVDNQPLAFVQWTGFLLLVILLSVSVIRWRLHKRARVLAFHRGQTALLALAVGCAVAFIPVAGATVADPWQQGVYVSMGLFSIPALWLTAVVCGSVFINSPKLLQHAVVARALIPAFATAALLAFLAVPFYKAAALHWFHQEKLLRVDPEHPAMSKYEYECAVQMRKETRATLGICPLRPAWWVFPAFLSPSRPLDPGMPDIRDQLIETAIRPLEANAEMKAAARHFLGEVVESTSPDAESVVKRWGELDGEKPKPWRLLPWILLVIVSVGTVVSDHHEISRYVAWRGWIGGPASYEMPASDMKLIARLTPAQQLLATPDETDDVKRSKALWPGDPDNPAFFSEYAATHIKRENSLPPDFQEIVSRIDPDNSWFTYLMASVEARNSVEQGMDATKKETWKMLDQARLDRSTELMRKARTQTQFETYSFDMMRLRLEGQPARSRIEQMDLIPLLFTYPTLMTRMFDCQSVIQFHSWKATEENDPAGFRASMEEADHFITSMVRLPVGTLLEGVILRGMVASTADRLSKGGAKLGLDSEVTKWTDALQRLQAIREAGKTKEFIVEGRPGNPGLMVGSLYGISEDLSSKILEKPLKLTDSDIEPARMLDHEILSRFSSYFLWITMAACVVLLTAYRLRVPRLVWFLAGRVESLLDGRDRGWIVGAGIALPFAWVILVNRLTPLGGREFGMLGNALLLPTAHFAGLLVLWLTVPAQVARWRLAKRAGALGFRKAGISGWIVVACATAFIPLIGWAAISQSYPDYWDSLLENLSIELPGDPQSAWKFHLALGVVAIPLLWIFGVVLQALLSRADRVMHHAILTQILVRSSAAGMIFLALAPHGFKSAERHWFERDKIGRADPAKPGWSAYEHDIAARLSEELREILGVAR